MSKRGFLRAAGAAAAGVLLQACGGGGGSDDGAPIGTDSLMQRLQADSRFSAMAQAVDRAGLTATLGDASANLTLFAADNDGFARMATRLGHASTGDLISSLSPTQWAGIIRFGLTNGRLSAASLPVGSRPETLYTFRGNPQVLIFAAGNQIWDGVGRSSITPTQTDIGASNGVLHVVSDVLLPRGVLTVLQVLRVNIDSYSNFGASVGSNLDGSGPFTVFVPANGVVTSPLASNIVRLHIVSGREVGGDDFRATSVTMRTLAGRDITALGDSGGTLTYGGAGSPATITDTGIYGSNGVIHAIDRVMA